MPKTLFVSKLYNIKFDQHLGKGIHIGNDMLISDNNKFIRKYFLDNIIYAIGRIEYDDLQKGSFVYAIKEFDEDKIDTLNLLNNYLILMQLFFNTMWLRKDNSVNIEMGYIWETTPPYETSSNSRTPYFSNSEGETSETIFTKKEIKEICKIMQKKLSIDGSSFEEWGLLEERPGRMEPTKNNNRLELSFFLLQIARSISYIPAKIAGYCSIFETLLTIDSAEISHKISERTAMLIGDPSERMGIYNAVKKAYSIRSNYIHGELPSKGEQYFKDISKECDSILRRLLLKILGNKELQGLLVDSNNEKLNEWFIQLVLSEERCHE